jgi:penicillin-binding protein-related factor A (putative recombinase)
MFPNHPNLLPAYFDDPKSSSSNNARDAYPYSKNTVWVAKPKYGREGEGIKHSDSYALYESFLLSTEVHRTKLSEEKTSELSENLQKSESEYLEHVDAYPGQKFLQVFYETCSQRKIVHTGILGNIRNPSRCWRKRGINSLDWIS